MSVNSKYQGDIKLILSCTGEMASKRYVGGHNKYKTIKF